MLFLGFKPSYILSNKKLSTKKSLFIQSSSTLEKIIIFFCNPLNLRFIKRLSPNIRSINPIIYNHKIRVKTEDICYIYTNIALCFYLISAK